MSKEKYQVVGNHFSNIWPQYLQSVNNNHLHHAEMNDALRKFLADHFKQTKFSFADLGCGDGSTILEILLNTPVEHYLGIDIAETLISQAPKLFTKLNCKKEFICEDMSVAIKKIPHQLDIIYSSYALHHFSHEEKIEFIQDCQDHLAADRHFILVDIVTKENQNRNQWYAEFKQRFYQNNPHLTAHEIQERLAHPRDYDFPESISTYQNIAKMQNWRSFETLLSIDGCAFMVFAK